MKSAQLDFSEEIWQVILSRDSQFDGKIFYGVHSTKIYCRPSCPSRKPHRNRVTFFQSAPAAEAQGFRPCKRCQPQRAIAPTLDKILAICRYIDAQSDRIPTLTELSTQVAMSPTHFQKVFKQTIGVTPFEYGNAQRRERLKQHLQQGTAITDALYEVGYGSSSRLYEKALQKLGMTPARYKQHGRGEEILYASVNSPLGYLTIAATKQGICSVKLGDDLAKLENELHNEFCHALLQRADDELQEWIQVLVNYLTGKLPLPELPYDVKATVFQIQVWEALKQIPLGTTVSYSDVACSIGHPTAVRAVARACATNPVALIIPCHRVLPKAGGLGGYRWGVSRKQALLEMEQQYTQTQRPS
jgi:AraC family transcriptional regulator of adaptative response/methylated-DNA-[protein]-cysteine methyltransferase